MTRLTGRRIAVRPRERADPIVSSGTPDGYDADMTASARQADATIPARIHADRAAGTLEIEWRDGHHTSYDATTLRWMCPCAFCRGEAGLPGWLDSAPTLTPDQTRLVDAHLVGSYAIAPTWADGHHTGFYAFTMLREHCRCAECTAARENR
jgi:DUF971 family protein